MLPVFAHASVRDMAWIAFSPALLDDQLLPMRDPLRGSVWRDDPEQLLHALALLDEDPATLEALLGDSPDRRLGNYYERLWHALLTLAPDTRILAHNLALRDGAHTYGELDLIIQAADSAIVHLELAIKFYLARPELPLASGQTSDPASWWGVDPRDNLANKLKRLREHQLPLGGRLAELATTHRALPLPDCSAAWLQGGLFQPLHNPVPPVLGQIITAAPYHWCHRHELASLDAEERWLPMAHKAWLMPPAASEAPALGPSEMRARSDRSGNKRAVMFCRAGQALLESERLLCVDDVWPHD